MSFVDNFQHGYLLTGLKHLACILQMIFANKSQGVDFFLNWKELYKQRLTTPEQAVKVIKSGDIVVPGHAASESELLVNAMVKRYKELENVNREDDRFQTMEDILC